MKAVSVLGVMMIKGMTYFKIGNNKKFSHRMQRDHASAFVSQNFGQGRVVANRIKFYSHLL